MGSSFWRVWYFGALKGDQSFAAPSPAQLCQVDWHLRQHRPRPSIYPLLNPKCPLFGSIYPYVRVQGGSWLLSQPGDLPPHIGEFLLFFSLGTLPPAFALPVFLRLCPPSAGLQGFRARLEAWWMACTDVLWTLRSLSVLTESSESIQDLSLGSSPSYNFEPVLRSVNAAPPRSLNSHLPMVSIVRIQNNISGAQTKNYNANNRYEMSEQSKPAEPLLGFWYSGFKACRTGLLELPSSTTYEKTHT